MNKSEKIICIILGAVLAWYVFFGNKKPETQSETTPAAEVQAPTETAAPVATAEAKTSATPIASVKPNVPERTVKLENENVVLELSSWGASVKKVTLKKFAKSAGAISAENPAVELDFSESPLGAGEAIEPFEVIANDSQSVTFGKNSAKRKISIENDYRIKIEDEGLSGSMCIGSMRMGDSKNDLLSVDSWAVNKGKGKAGVIHHGDDDSPLKPYLVGGLSGGCSGSSSAAGMPAVASVEYPGAQTWVAIKNRFFVTALAECSEANTGFSSKVVRDQSAANYKPESVSVSVKFGANVEKRSATFYVGPKKQALLWDLGMKDVMEFGMWRWLCYPLVWVLNFFNSWVPNFGIAIILLTILVRVLFWPLTHKSTVGMKKMQEIQPLMKEIQAKYKDNPQRLQQETWQLYRDKKVNPMSSCLPMFIQIPVFIALFNVLRSAVELRYAPFLWIADLSEPEALFASWFPFGGLNILPILMAATTALQSAFTPSTGDKSQQKMMMIFMPAMMLVMFYSFPSALSLYWFLSNIFSIVQMWLIRRSAAKKNS